MKTALLFLLLLVANFAIAQLEPCALCKGSGAGIVFKPVPCQACNAKGVQGACMNCQGAGVIRVFAYRGPCYPCFGTGKQRCFPCSGTGSLQQPVPGGSCIACKGKKRVTRQMNSYIRQQMMATQETINKICNPFYVDPEPTPDPEIDYEPKRRFTLTCYHCNETYTPVGGMLGCPRCRVLSAPYTN